MIEMLEAALAYARSGWYVFPCDPPIMDPGVPLEVREKSGKRPYAGLVPNGKDDSTTDEQLIRSWWERCPDANVGIDCARSGLVVLDVDVSHGKHGRESLALIDNQLGDSLAATTGSGGLHGYYARPQGVEPFTSIGLPHLPYPALDLIGNGYVVAPPSRHYTGGVYSWSRRVAIAPMPSVLEVVRQSRHSTRNVIASADVGTVPIAEGGRNNALFKLGAALRATGIDRDALRAAMHLENRRRFSPPLGDDEVETIAASVMTRVHPERDVALGAIVQDDIQALFADELPEQPAMWARDVAARPAPPMRMYQTGSAQLDALLGGGLASGVVTGIIGPPSCGKSAFVGTLLERLQATLPVLHLSDELTRREVMVRYAASRKRFPWRDALKGKHDAELAGAVGDLRIKIIGTDTLDRNDPLGQLAREALQMRDECGEMPAITIDYMQLLVRGGDDGVRARVGELSLKTRILAQALDVPILAVFSTSRAFYGGGGKLETIRQANDPTAYLAAAKESGDVDYDCGAMLYLDVDQLTEGASKPACAVVARSRYGDIGFAGYRAHLDVGVWEPDPLARSEMMSENRQAKRVEEDDLKREQRFLEIVRAHDGRAWNQIRDHHMASVGGHTVADRIKDRLVDAGRISIVDGYSKDTARRCYLVRVNEIGAAPVGVVPGKEQVP